MELPAVQRQVRLIVEGEGARLCEGGRMKSCKSRKRSECNPLFQFETVFPYSVKRIE